MNEVSSELFEGVIEFPDPTAQRRFRQLVGLDNVKNRLLKEASIMLNPSSLERWSNTHYGRILPLIAIFRDRPRLFVFAGDVGTGKTALAETFGDQIARSENLPISLYRLSLNARGTGAVGEMTRLISSAFAEAHDAMRQGISQNGKPRSAVILLIDEADALAQSRELAQMHHEDRAGVNALVRGIDELSDKRLPGLVVMCTNRLEALDPAVRRRAAEIFFFERPNLELRIQVLGHIFQETGLTPSQIQTLAKMTGESEHRPYGHTYSDLVQRLLPTAVLDAFPEGRISYERLVEIAARMQPTVPFGKGGDS